MFVQGPQMVHEKSENSDEVSDEEGSGDILQVNYSDQINESRIIILIRRE